MDSSSPFPSNDIGLTSQIMSIPNKTIDLVSQICGPIKLFIALATVVYLVELLEPQRGTVAKMCRHKQKDLLTTIAVVLIKAFFYIAIPTYALHIMCTCGYTKSAWMLSFILPGLFLYVNRTKADLIC